MQSKYINFSNNRVLNISWLICDHVNNSKRLALFNNYVKLGSRLIRYDDQQFNYIGNPVGSTVRWKNATGSRFC